MRTLRSMKSYVQTVLSGSFLEVQTSQIESHTQLRHSFRSRMLMTFALLFVMIGLPQAASAVTTDITACPAEITSPGLYRLAVDCVLTDPGTTGISIGASNVRLNLGGHTISGPVTATGDCADPFGNFFGIHMSASNVHVHSGTVEGVTLGIQVNGDNNHLNGLTVTRNCQGISLSAGVADNRIEGTKVSSSFIDGVLVFGGTTGNVFNENVINDNGADDLVGSAVGPR